MPKFKASTDDKFGLAEIMGFVFERVENIVGKGENAGYQHFLLFLLCSQKASHPGLLKVRIVWQRINQKRTHHVVSMVEMEQHSHNSLPHNPFKDPV